LQTLEIPPSADASEIELAGLISHEVIDRVIRRAEELRKSWSKTNGASARSSTRASAAAPV